MAEFITVPIETDPEDILQDAYSFLQAVIGAGWTPAQGNLDVWLLQAISSAAAESRDVASQVPLSIFRYFGANLLNLPPIDEAQATAPTTWTLRDALGYTIPAGTQLAIAVNGEDMIAFETVQDVVVPPGSATTGVGAVLVQAIEGGLETSGLGSPGASITGGVVVLLDPLDFVTNITMTAATSGGQDAESDDDYLNRLATELQLLAPRPILAPDFAIFARNIAGVFRATAIDNYNPYHNLLTLNQASAETDASGWTNIANTTIGSTGAQSLDGVKSVSMTAIAAADMTAATPATAGTGVPVVAGETYTALASLRSAVTARSCQVGLQWLDAANAQIGATVYGAAANDSAAAWTNYFVTAIAPALAVRARVVVKVIGAAIAEVHYVDRASFRHGSGTDWVPGGTIETGVERMVTVIGIDEAGAALSAPVKASVLADLDARRELNFVINVIDPWFNLINVTYNVKVLPGYNTGTVISNVNAALNGYINPVTWGTRVGDDPRDWPNVTTLRYLEVAQVINAAEGVDYITTTGGLYDLTIGIQGGPAAARTDLLLAGVAPLPDANTLTGTAV